MKASQEWVRLTVFGEMVWADLSGTALRVSARVNHSLTAVPDRADASESAPTSKL